MSAKTKKTTSDNPIEQTPKTSKSHSPRTYKTKKKSPDLDLNKFKRNGEPRKLPLRRIKKRAKVNVDGRVAWNKKQKEDKKARLKEELEQKKSEGALSINDLKRITKKCTDTVINDLVKAFRNDCTIVEACFYAQISHDSFQDWRSWSVEFKEKMEAANASFYTDMKFIVAEDARGGTVKKQVFNPQTEEMVEVEEIIAPNPGRAMNLLIRRQPKRYAIKSTVDLQNTDGSLTANPWDKLPLARRIAIAKELEKANKGASVEQIEDTDDVDVPEFTDEDIEKLE